ncbi:hypothetical protein [Pedobacter heparinus]|nr:hypothetical protein [Pedobacter heparinus]
MNQSAFVISGYQIGPSEIMLVLFGFFVLFLIVRNIILYQLKPKDK